MVLQRFLSFFYVSTSTFSCFIAFFCANVLARGQACKVQLKPLQAGHVRHIVIKQCKNLGNKRRVMKAALNDSTFAAVI